MGFYDGSKTKLWDYAERYTLADHFFHAAFGGSFLNHFWMICACTPRYENAPKNLKADPDIAFDNASNLVEQLKSRIKSRRRICGEHIAAVRSASPEVRPTLPLQTCRRSVTS